LILDNYWYQGKQNCNEGHVWPLPCATLHLVADFSKIEG